MGSCGGGGSCDGPVLTPRGVRVTQVQVVAVMVVVVVVHAHTWVQQPHQGHQQLQLFSLMADAQQSSSPTPPAFSPPYVLLLLSPRLFNQTLAFRFCPPASAPSFSPSTLPHGAGPPSRPFGLPPLLPHSPSVHRDRPFIPFTSGPRLALSLAVSLARLSPRPGLIPVKALTHQWSRSVAPDTNLGILHSPGVPSQLGG